jgi:hypothetical protein
MAIDHDDSRRTLEQHALRNVRGLVDKLELRDEVELRTQKVILLASGSLVVVLILAMTLHTIIASPRPEQGKTAACEQDFRVARVWELRKELAAQQPRMSEQEISQRVEVHYKDMKSLARIACSGGYKHGD